MSDPRRCSSPAVTNSGTLWRLHLHHYHGLDSLVIGVTGDITRTFGVISRVAFAAGDGDMSRSLDFQIPLTGIKSSIRGWDAFYPSHWNEDVQKSDMPSLTHLA